MFDVLFSEQATQGINQYTDYYEECFVKLFNDSGIWSEEVILEKYRVAAKELNHLFVDEIVKRVQKNAVLGRKNTGEWIEIAFYLKTRLVTVYYTENKNQKERVIEFISINQKITLF